MTFRAIITQVIDNYHCKVRIPQLNKIKEALGATPDSELYTATIAAISGIQPAYRVGDAVFVTCENSDNTSPLIIGLIYNSKSKLRQSDCYFGSAVINSKAVLPKDTAIGNVNSTNIECLEGLTDNINSALISIKSTLGSYNTTLTTLSNNSEVIDNTLAAHASDIQDLSSDLDYLTSQYETLDTKVDLNIKTFSDGIKANKTSISTLEKHTGNNDIHVTKTDKSNWNAKCEKEHTHKFSDITGKIDELILDKALYGENLPSTGTDGQIFFLYE